MKKISCLIFAGLLALSLTACGGNQSTTSTPPTVQSSVVTPQPSIQVSQNSIDPKNIDLSTINFTVIDFDIARDDYDTLNSTRNLAEENIAKVVKITGYFESNDEGNTYIYEYNNTTGSGTGLPIVVEGLEEKDYPEYKTCVEILGVVEKGDGKMFHIKVPANKFKIIEKPAQS